MVYVDKRDRFVYKIEQYEPNKQNTKEHKRATEARRAGVPGVPRTFLWKVDTKVVLCMRRYPDPSVETAELLDKTGIISKWEGAGFKDMHSWNMTLTPGGQPRVIDMGGYS